MFEDFLYLLRKNGLKVSLTEWMALMEGLEKNLHGALVYGIGNSAEAIYYVDFGSAECMVVPDEFNMGYQSLSEVAGSLAMFSGGMESRTVSHTVIRRENLFTEENQEILFTMSQ